MSLNVFESLAGYSTHQSENYLTESFAFLLRLLLNREPAAGLAVINRLCRWQDGSGFTEAKAVSVFTQPPVEGGQPDMAISSPDRHVFVEVKEGSRLGSGQLEWYWQELRKVDVPERRLVLLTRSRSAAEDTTLDADCFRHACWFEIHRWLGAAQLSDPIAIHYVTQFTEFLEMKSMSLARIEWEYIAGVPALINFTEMVWAAAGDAIPEAEIKRTSGWSWRGMTLGQSLWCGLRYDDHLRLVFENNTGTNPTYKRDFDLEGTKFFAMTEDEQFHVLVEFLRTAYEEALSSASETVGEES